MLTSCRRFVLLVGACWIAGQAPGAELEPGRGELERHVATLASREFQGRRGEGATRAADYVVKHLRALGLEPLFGERFEQPIPGKAGEPPIGKNVGALLRGSDPALREEWVIVSAHFDHLGTRGDLFYPGADDNASGVAMMLEVARAVTRRSAPPKRSIMFVGFDLEEAGLLGSRYFVEHSPVQLDRVALFLTADMIGRSLGGVCAPNVFVMGSEHAPRTRPWIREASQGMPLEVGLLGSDLLLINRSDYGPFRSRKVPYLFFSTGENPAYHTPSDIPETIDYDKLTLISRLVLGIVTRCADSAEAPSWRAVPDNPIEEALAIRDVLRKLLENKEKLRVGFAQAMLMRNALRTLDGIAERGAITPEERSGVVQVARIILVSVF